MKKNTLSINQLISNLGIEALNEMQLASMGACQKGKDLVLLSPTGSGKTLAFLLPIIKTLDFSNPNIQALVLTPSRELALQIEQVFKGLKTGLKVNCCYGGHSIKTELNNLSEPPALLIGTPGRVADFLTRRKIDLGSVETIVFDEFDKSLEFGFQDQMAYIMNNLPAVKQRILISATSSIEIPEFAGVHDPLKLDFLDSVKTNDKLELRYVISETTDKLQTLLKLICTLGAKPMLIFLNHRDAVERVSDFLTKEEIVHEFFHGGLEQDDRERTIAKFRNGSCQILVTTDLASRGLDIPEIEYIIHYHLPQTEEAFTHRNGRTARMNAGGMAYLILTSDETLPKYIGAEIEEIKLQENLKKPKMPAWLTLYIGKGKKDGVNKVDIVGFLCQKGGLKKEDIGLIEVKDFFSYVAITRKNPIPLVKRLRDEKIKNLKAKIDLAR